MNPTPIQDAMSYRNEVLNQYAEYLNRTDESLWEMSNGFIRTAKKLDHPDWVNWPPLPSDTVEFSVHEAGLFMDLYSGEFFMSTPDLVQQAMYHLNRNICLKGYEVLSEWYGFLGIGEVYTTVENLGWSQDYLLAAQNSIWVDFVVQSLVTGDGEPYLAIAFEIDPVPFEDEGY